MSKNTYQDTINFPKSEGQELRWTIGVVDDLGGRREDKREREGGRVVGKRPELHI